VKRWCALSEVPYPANRIFVGQNRIDDDGPNTGTIGPGAGAVPGNSAVPQGATAAMNSPVLAANSATAQSTLIP